MDNKRANSIFRSDNRTLSLLVPEAIAIFGIVIGLAFIGSEFRFLRVQSFASTALTCPADITQPNDPNRCTKNITYTPPLPASGGTVSCLPASGSTFPVGTTVVTCKETNAAGTVVSECNFNVTIQDRELPVFTCPPTTQINASASCQTPVIDRIQGLTVTDNCTPSNQIVVSQTPAAGTLVGKGDNNIEIIARDASGNERRCTSILRVVDTTGPTISGLQDIVINNIPGQCAALLAYTLPTASDSCDGARPVTCTPAAGQRLTVGMHTVQCVTRDISGNETPGTFVVNIKDNEPPRIECPSGIQGLLATNPLGAIAVFGPPAVIDNCGVTQPDCDRKSGTMFPIGSINNRCAVSDIHGNQSDCAFSIEVIGPKFDLMLRGQTSNDSFQMVTCPGVPAHFGYWEYHKAATAGGQEEVYYGYANSIRNNLGVVTVEDHSSKDYLLNATLNPYSKVATVEVTIIASTTNRRLVTTNYVPKACN